MLCSSSDNDLTQAQAQGQAQGNDQEHTVCILECQHAARHVQGHP